MALFDLANSNAQVSAVTLASYGDEHWGKPRPQWPHGGIWWHIQPCVFPLLCYCFHWWTKRGQHQPNVDLRGPGGHLRKLSRLWNKNRQELYPLVWARLLDLESYKHPGISVGLQKKQIWYLRILLSESQAEAWLLSNSDYLMGSENLYRCFQGKLKDLLLGGMVLPVPQDRGPALHSGSNCLERWATGCRVSARLWVRTPKTTFPFSWVYSWIVWVE